MNLEHIQRKLQEIYQLRSTLIREIEDGKAAAIVKGAERTKGRREINDVSELKVAAIMDEFTYHSFAPEFTILQLTPENWETEIKSFRPDLFFLESAWLGKEGLWHSKIAHLSIELIGIIDYCKHNDIPVVFWNKEDPVHFDTFLATAKYADFVFTTDIDCIRRYKTVLKHDRVYLLPFAAQTKVHNPIEKYQRKDKFCFAGAYYKRYPERIRDLETFINTISQFSDIEIYDRNYHIQDPNYNFPKSYSKYIKGTLKPEEIDKAYKAYRFNINMNSVKQSQSMCARRVFELLASNTVTVSNYSLAIRNIFGDLVVCTDDGMRLKSQLSLFENEEYYLKLRLAGLRKALSEHTYTNRVFYLAEKVLGLKNKRQWGSVAIIASVDSEADMERVKVLVQRQSYRNIKLFILSNKNLIVPEMAVLVQNPTEEWIEEIQSIFDFVAFFSKNDYYGPNYIYDFMTTREYVQADVITKSVYFENSPDGITKQRCGVTYQWVSNATIRKSMLKCGVLDNRALLGYLKSIDEGELEGRCFSIDEYNYCMNFYGTECSIVDDMNIPDVGVSINDLYSKAEQIRAARQSLNYKVVNAEEINNSIKEIKTVEKRYNDNLLFLKINQGDNHNYIYFNNIYNVQDLAEGLNLNLYFNADVSPGCTVNIAVITLDHEQRKINGYVYPCNRNISLILDEGTRYIKFAIRVSGIGSAKIREIIFGNMILDTGCHINKSNVLLITDNYPDYNDLYRYAFIHSRLAEYKRHGKLVDVFKCNDRYPASKTEFGGINVITGYHKELIDTLAYGGYDIILIHFLTRDIWDGIKNSIHGKRVIVWIHGAEIQPWWRRKYNYKSNDELERAKRESDKRMDFWKEIFNLSLNINEYDLHFVFVSNYFAKEVFEDLKIELPAKKYSIIHNYINTELFSYKEKDAGQRKKILSIRPFANMNYANDLTVKAIQELSKYEFFNQLEFRIIGKGELLHSIVKPIKKYKNVVIEERFLRQEEIAELHKDYGVFLVPTRMDTQGVSRDEAMSSGLVPITNRVAAVPEFVDESTGILVDPEDYRGLAEAIKRLYYNPDLFKKLSRQAAQRVRRQSGIKQTIIKELALIENSRQ